MRLQFADKRGAPIVAKLLKSAVANAGSTASAIPDNLFVKEVQVNQGVTMKRSMPRARGSASRINKRTSHINIILGDISGMKTKIKKDKSQKLAAKS